MVHEGQQIYEVEVLKAWAPSRSCRALRLTRPAGFAFEAAHAVRLFLEDPAFEDARALSRTMSIASGPQRPHLDFAVRISDSAFKRRFRALRSGDRLWLRGPKGRFLLDPSRPAVMFAGGIGITPFRGMLQAVADAGSDQRVLLVYANHDPTDVPFRDELEALVSAAPGAELLLTVSTAGGEEWPHRVGRVERDLVRYAAERLPGAGWYAAGPPDFVRALMEWALEVGVQKDALHAEVFKGYDAALLGGP